MVQMTMTNNEQRTVKKIINVLLVEDNQGDARLVSEYLKENENCNFNIVNADCLASALLIIKDKNKDKKLQPDVVILDLGLPDCSGLETFRKIWTETEEGLMLPIIVLTGAILTSGNLRFCIQESQNFLFKSDMDSKVLVSAIENAIERQAAKKKVMLLINEMRNKNLFNRKEEVCQN